MITFSFDILNVGKAVLLLAAAVLAFMALRGLVRAVRRWMFKPELHGLDRKGVEARWADIEKMTGAGEMQMKIAVMEADKLLDHALKAMSFPGMSLGDRLKFAAYKYPKIREVWWAHRLRNQLVHESSFYLEPHMARKAVQMYKDALRLLNLL